MVSEYPCLVEEVQTKEGVEGLVLKGANLMWDGVADAANLGKFEKDAVRAILDSKGTYCSPTYSSDSSHWEPWDRIQPTSTMPTPQPTYSPPCRTNSGSTGRNNSSHPRNSTSVNRRPCRSRSSSNYSSRKKRRKQKQNPPKMMTDKKT